MHGLKSPSPLCALDRGEGQGVFCWRRRCQKLSLKGVKTAWCTGSCLGGGVQCDMRHGAAVSLNNMKSVFFFQKVACLIPIKCQQLHSPVCSTGTICCHVAGGTGAACCSPMVVPQLSGTPLAAPLPTAFGGVPAASPTTAPPAEGLRGVSSVNALQQL